jgi:hypothetical protein
MVIEGPWPRSRAAFGHCNECKDAENEWEEAKGCWLSWQVISYRKFFPFFPLYRFVRSFRISRIIFPFFPSYRKFFPFFSNMPYALLTTGARLDRHVVSICPVLSHLSASRRV